MRVRRRLWQRFARGARPGHRGCKRPNGSLTTPEPVCHITEFGDNAVNMVLRFWIDDPAEGVTNIKGDVFLSLWETFKEQGSKSRSRSATCTCARCRRRCGQTPPGRRATAPFSRRRRSRSALPTTRTELALTSSRRPVGCYPAETLTLPACRASFALVFIPDVARVDSSQRKNRDKSSGEVELRNSKMWERPYVRYRTHIGRR